MAKTALVTGASRGIGKAIALSLAAAGYDLALAARTVAKDDPTPEHTLTVHHRDTRPLPGSIEETAEAVEAAGRRALRLRMDLTDLDSVERAIATLLDSWGGVDLVIQNGRHIGPGLMDTVLDTPLEEYPKFLQAHAVSAIRIAQLLLPPMIEKKSGTFITVSSGAAYDYYPDSPPGQAGSGLGYRLGKAAGHMLAGAIAVEHNKDGIRSFNVDPGFVLTERNALGLEDTGYDASWAAPPAAIGAVVAWIADSPEADELQPTNVTAQELAIERSLYPDWRKK